MPIELANILIEDSPCIIPSRLKGECDRKGIPTDTWWHKANRLSWMVGGTPAEGCFLVTREVAEQLVHQSQLTVKFVQTQAVIECKVIPIRTQTITPGHPEDDPKSAVMLEVSDRRHTSKRSAVNLHANILGPEAFEYFGAGVPTMATVLNGADWDQLCQNLWDQTTLGGYPGLPYGPSGNPSGFHLPVQNALDALICVLDKLGCTISWNPVDDSYAIVVYNDAADLTQLGVTLDKWDAQRPAHWHVASLENTLAKLPGTIRVAFPSRDWSYGHNIAMLSTQDEWRLKPVYTVDIGANGIGVVELHDDMPARFDAAGNVLNGSELYARAGERAAYYLQAIQQPPLHRIYSGLCDGDFNQTSGALHGVAYYDFGGGLKTEIVRYGTPWGLDQTISDPIHGAFLTPSVIENVGPPDLARHTIPYQRFGWFKLLEPMEQYKCAAAVVLAQDASGPEAFKLCNKSWRETEARTLIADPTGGVYPQYTICFCWYHQQSDTWTIVRSLGGGGGGWWSRLTNRSGEAHSHIEVVRPTSACVWDDVPSPPGIRGVLNAFEINCSSHNSQGPKYDLIVQMFGPFIDSETQKVFYLFDYSGTNELDIERYPFSP